MAMRNRNNRINTSVVCPECGHLNQAGPLIQSATSMNYACRIYCRQCHVLIQAIFSEYESARYSLVMCAICGEKGVCLVKGGMCENALKAYTKKLHLVARTRLRNIAT